MTQSIRCPRQLATLACAAATLTCANLGPFVSVEDYPQPPPPEDKGYVIARGDLLQVRVFNQEGMSAKVRVRSDGRVSLPFLNDVEAAGYTPSVLAEQLQVRLKEYINVPVVTISLEELRPIPVSVLGEVVRPGLYQLELGSGVLQALAVAGGLTEFAHRDRIFVLRQTPAPARIRFTFEALVHAQGKAASFRLQVGDSLVVE